MTTKERLHRLVDILPDADAETAARVLEALAASRDPAALAAALAADDDEPTTTADRAALAERETADPVVYADLGAVLRGLDGTPDAPGGAP